jgi:hypothetical protein
MQSMLAAWLIFLFASSAVSILAMTYIQVRAASKYGWRGLRQRPFLDTYWRELSMLERAFLWPGLAGFVVTLVAAALWKVAASVG